MDTVMLFLLGKRTLFCDDQHENDIIALIPHLISQTVRSRYNW